MFISLQTSLHRRIHWRAQNQCTERSTELAPCYTLWVCNMLAPYYALWVCNMLHHIMPFGCATCCTILCPLGVQHAAPYYALWVCNMLHHIMPFGCATYWHHIMPFGCATYWHHIMPFGCATYWHHIMPFGCATYWHHIMPFGCATCASTPGPLTLFSGRAWFATTTWGRIEVEPI